MWWPAEVVVLPFVLGFGGPAVRTVRPPTVANHDFGVFLAAKDERGLLHGNSGLYILILVMMTFNTVLGEELLFRRLLLLKRGRGPFPS